MAHERQCKICGSTYKYCPRCAQYAHLPRWKSLYCSDDCKTIYSIADQYIAKKIDKDEAKLVLDSYNVSIITNEEIKNIVSEIMVIDEEPKKKKKQKIEEEIPAIESVLEDIEIVNVD